MAARKDSFIFRWIVTSIAVLAATQVVSGIESDGWVGLLVVALLLGVFNAIFKPILFLLTLPLQILTLGLFTLVINAVLLMFAGALVPSFHIAGFGSAFFAALIISVVSAILNTLFGGGREVQVQVRKPPASRKAQDTGSGPIIDV